MSQLELCPVVGCRVTAAALYAVVVSCGVGPSQLGCLSSHIGQCAVLQSSLSCMGLCGPAARTGGIFAQLLGVFDESCGLKKVVLVEDKKFVPSGVENRFPEPVGEDFSCVQLL